MIRTIKCVPRMARKEYRCIWCGQDIHAGEPYIRALIDVDGYLQDQHWHSECLEHLILIDKTGQVEFDPYSHNRPSADALEWIYPQ